MSNRVSLKLSSVDHQGTLLEFIPSHFFIKLYKHVFYMGTVTYVCAIETV